MADRSPATLATWGIAALLALFAVWKAVGPGERGAADAVPVEVGAGARPERGAAAKQGLLYMHVAGAVQRPGLVRLRPGARVAAALERAGGPTRGADLTSVNLAARVEDGQQIVVPRAGAGRGASSTGAASAAASGSAAGAGGKLSLASATVEQLETLDGIGPTLAGRIVDYREQHGGFRSLDELKEVDGIGDKRFAALSESVVP